MHLNGEFKRPLPGELTGTLTERFHQSLDNKTPDEVYEFLKAA